MNKPNLPQLQLILVDDAKNTIPTTVDDARSLEASCLAMDERDFCALTDAAWCGGAGGAAPAGGFDDMPRLFRFPSYGQA